MQKQVRKQFSKLSLDEWESPATFLDELLQLSSEDEVIEACVDLGCDPEPAAKLAQLLMRYSRVSTLHVITVLR